MSSIHSVASSDPFTDRHAAGHQPPASPQLSPAAGRPPSYSSFEAPPVANRYVAPAPAPLPQAPLASVPSAPVAAPVTPIVVRAVPNKPVAAPNVATAPQPRRRAANQGFLRTYTTPGQLLPPKLEPLTSAERASVGRGKSLRVKLQESLLKHTSGVGLAKIGAKIGLLGLAGVGSYFAVTQIIALVHAGVSAKAGAILLPVGIAVAATLAIVVLAYMVTKSFKAMRRDLKGQLTAQNAPSPELLQPAR